MKILANDEWSDGYLDYHRPQGYYRLRVVAWRTLSPVDDLYFVRPRSIRLVYNYLREIGGREVLRKIASRTEERIRNEKYVSCGLGQVVEHDSQEFETGAHVVFVAPSHPACVERIVLPAQLLTHADRVPGVTPTSLHYCGVSAVAKDNRWWEALAGWSPLSGTELPSNMPELLAEALRLVAVTDWTAARRLPISAGTSVRERDGELPERRHGSRKSAVLLGYGNYAKTVILPNVLPNIDVACVHELDPTQIPRRHRGSWSWDTSALPREDRKYDAWIIAGYHHTHAPLAALALDAGSYAVVEKPLATDRAQLDTLARSLHSSRRLFAGFHKRYSPMNNWARTDLDLVPGQAVSYHCIVYEVPLPERHWYRWPNARSRIVSNGCHWIDHFLYLNDYSPVDSLDVHTARCGTVNCFVALANGACFTMVLTDRGAARVGVQEHIELRSNGITVRITDGSFYRAEDSRRILRRARAHKYSGFRRMYRAIGRAIQQGDAGDSPESTIASTQLVLALEDRFQSTNA